MKTDLKAKYVQHLISKKKNNEGFTLIELLVVIIIIGILSAIALPSFLNQANKARQSEAETYIGSINRAQQAEFLEENSFASDLADLELGLIDTENYTYAIPTGGTLTGTTATIEATATPDGTLKGIAGRTFVTTGTDGNATTFAIVCEGDPGALPTVTAVTAVANCP